MKFTIGIKPTIIKGSGTLKQAMERIDKIFFSSSTYGDGYVDLRCHSIINPKYVYGYNIEVFKRGKHRKDKHYVIYRYTFPIEIFPLLNIRIKQGRKTFKIIHKQVNNMEKKDGDLCLTCEHYWEDFPMPYYWEDFPMPLGYFISHCDKVDEKYGFKDMDECVPYPCLECPFNCYSPKK